jgi:hypothetical protein
MTIDRHALLPLLSGTGRETDKDRIEGRGSVVGVLSCRVYQDQKSRRGLSINAGPFNYAKTLPGQPFERLKPSRNLRLMESIPCGTTSQREGKSSDSETVVMLD